MGFRDIAAAQVRWLALPRWRLLLTASWLCSVSVLAQSPGVDQAASVATGRTRLEFKGLYLGMPGKDLPSSLKPTGGPGQFAGFVGEDFFEALVWKGTLDQLAIVYVAEAQDGRPRIDRRLSLQDAWRLHSIGDSVPEFGLYLTHLYLVDGIIDSRNLIVYRLRFPHRRYTRDAPPLFDAQTRVERVVYFRDRVDLASNLQPINSVALVKLINERYRDAFTR